jgi:NADPH-dependent ferric siderophore reductase
MGRIVLTGPELDGFAVDEPAASVRVLLPQSGERVLEVPDWTGNQFLLPGDRRPTIRTLTPRRFDSSKLELELNVVIHGGGAASTWAASARSGDPAAVSGPARGYSGHEYDPEARAYLLVGDETAIPAVSQLVEELPSDLPIDARIEVASPEARLDLPGRADLNIEWMDLPPGALPGETLVRTVHDANLGPGTRVWAAGEAAAMQRIRRELFDRREVSRGHATVRGYWKHGRAGDGGD